MSIIPLADSLPRVDPVRIWYLVGRAGAHAIVLGSGFLCALFLELSQHGAENGLEDIFGHDRAAYL